MADSRAAALTLEDVDRVAALAHLALTDAERHLFLAQLNDILGYARQIQDLDTSGVPPTSHGLGRHAPDRPDTLQPSLAIEDALGSAPDATPDDRLFRVPRVID